MTSFSRNNNNVIITSCARLVRLIKKLPLVGWDAVVKYRHFITKFTHENVWVQEFGLLLVLPMLPL